MNFIIGVLLIIILILLLFNFTTISISNSPANVNSYSNGYNLNNVRGSNQNYLISTMQQSDMLQSGMMINQNQSNRQNNYSIAKDQPVYDYNKYFFI